jgi:hypothetical protein
VWLAGLGQVLSTNTLSLRVKPPFTPTPPPCLFPSVAHVVRCLLFKHARLQYDTRNDVTVGHTTSGRTHAGGVTVGHPFLNLCNRPHHQPQLERNGQPEAWCPQPNTHRP